LSLRRARAESFLRHLEPLQGPLEGYCRRSLYNASDVPDVLQSVVAKAFRDFHLYAEGTNFRAWIFRYAHLEIQNVNRKQQRDRHEELPQEASRGDSWDAALDGPLFQVLLDEPEIVLHQCDAAVARAMRDLPPFEREVLLLHAVGEFKYREIADILAAPIGTVMSSLSRCRARLRQRLVQYGEEHGLLKRDRP
jgi:RNA polymerase sigma-70 factor (ECF subfamily)